MTFQVLQLSVRIRKNGWMPSRVSVQRRRPATPLRREARGGADAVGSTPIAVTTQPIALRGPKPGRISWREFADFDLLEMLLRVATAFPKMVAQVSMFVLFSPLALLIGLAIAIDWLQGSTADSDSRARSLPAEAMGLDARIGGSFQTQELQGWIAEMESFDSF